MDEIQTLDDVKREMEDLIGIRDYEIAHSDADSLLCEALFVLATDENRTTIQAIIDAFNKVGKWYA